MREFMMAALPWICIGIAIALFAVNHGATKKAKEVMTKHDTAEQIVAKVLHDMGN